MNNVVCNDTPSIDGPPQHQDCSLQTLWPVKRTGALGETFVQDEPGICGSFTQQGSDQKRMGLYGKNIGMKVLPQAKY